MTVSLGSDALLADLRSQALCLEDALSSGSDRALLAAFEAVVRARGLLSLAQDAGLDRASLAQIATTAGAVRELRAVVAVLLERWEASFQRDHSGFPERDSPEDEKT